MDQANKRIEDYLKTLTTTDLQSGGLLLAEQAKKFLDLTLDYSTLLKKIRSEPKGRKSGEIDTLNIGGVCTVPASEPATALEAGHEKLPDFGKVDYSLVKLRSAFDMSVESMIDNIESEIRDGGTPPHNAQDGSGPQGDFRDTLMNAYAKRISTDIEYQGLQGDTDLSYVIPGSPTMEELLLKSNDGWLKILQTAPTCALVNAGGLNISLALFADMLKALPSPYLKQLSELRWYTGPMLNIKWTEKVAVRQTAAGDEAMKGMTVAPFGIPMELVPLMPEDKTFGTLSNCGYILLTFPENLIYVYRRNVEMYWEFKPRGDKWENTTYTETDYAIENKAAAVLAYNVKVDATTDYGG